MGFYLRKSFRMGPVRLNLSKSGLGASIGVKGARVGITSRGRAYVHAGRGGLYVREYLGGSAARSLPVGARAEPVTLYEDTGVTYAPTAIASDRTALSRLDLETPTHAVWPYLLLPLGGLLLLMLSLGDGGVAHPVGFGLGLTMALVWPIPMWRALRRNRARLVPGRVLAPAIAEGRPLSDDELEAVRAALRDPHLTAAARRTVLERGYLDAARKIVDDGAVTPDEIRLLEQLEAELGDDTGFCRRARADAFRGLYLRAVADHDLSEEEERELEHVREALRVPEADVAAELETLRRLGEIRRIRDGQLPVVDPSKPLRASEVCHFEAPGRLLKEKNLRTFQRDGVKYRVRGLTIDKEGTLFITNKRVLLVHAGTSSVRMDRILDVEVDVDRNLIRITKDGTKSPTLVTTPDAVRAGAIIAAVRGL